MFLLKLLAGLSDSDFQQPEKKQKTALKVVEANPEPIRSTIFKEFDKNKRIRIRNSPKNLAEFMQVLSEEQKEEVDKMGFESMKNFDITKIQTDLGYWLTENYEPTINTLNLGTHNVVITPNLVQEVLGIPMGKVKVKELNKPSMNDPVVAEFRNQFNIADELPKMHHIINVVKEEKKSGRLFQLNFLVMFNSIMAELTHGGNVNMKFLTTLQPDVDIKDVDWCSYVIDCLNRKTVSWFQSKTAHYIGPITFLVLVYAHDTYQRTNPTQKMIPAVMYHKNDTIIKLGPVVESNKRKRSQKHGKSAQKKVVKSKKKTSLKAATTGETEEKNQTEENEKQKNLKVKLKLKKKPPAEEPLSTYQKISKETDEAVKQYYNDFPDSQNITQSFDIPQSQEKLSQIPPTNPTSGVVISILLCLSVVLMKKVLV